MPNRRRSRLEQRLTDDQRLVRIAVTVFGAMAVVVLLGLGAREFQPDWCARQMMERGAIKTSGTESGGCELTFPDGTVETLHPSAWAGYSLAAALGISMAVGIYLLLTRQGRPG